MNLLLHNRRLGGQWLPQAALKLAPAMLRERDDACCFLSVCDTA